MVDFRSALVSLAYQQALYSGDLRLVRQRYHDLQMHSLAGSATSPVPSLLLKYPDRVSKSRNDWHLHHTF
jgi:hypothetical protein